MIESLDYTPRRSAEAAEGVSGVLPQPVRAYFAHHQGMSLVALANVVLGDPMVRRFHSDPRVQATESLLQERPRAPRAAHPHATAGGDATWRRRRRRRGLGRSARRTRATPSRHFLSNGRYTTSVTNAGGGASWWHGLAVTRHREDPTRDPGSQLLYLRDVRSGRLWSPTYQPVRGPLGRYRVTFQSDAVLFERREDDIETRLEIAVSPEDDVEVRRLTLYNRSERMREIEVTSCGRGRDRPARRRPVASRRSPSCSSRPSSCRSAPPCCARGGRAPRTIRRCGRCTSPASTAPARGRWNGRPIARGSSAAAAAGRPAGARRARAVGLYRRGAGPGAVAEAARAADAGRARAARVRDRCRDVAGRRRGAGREVRRRGVRDAHARAGRHARRDAPGTPRRDARRGAVVRPPRLARARHGRLARRPRGAGAQRPRPGRAVAARHLGRPADAAGPHRRRRRPVAGAPRAARAGVLAAQGPGGGPGDPERATGGLPERGARPDRDAAPERAVGGLEGTPRRRVPAARRRIAGQRAHPAAGRGARGAERRQGRARRPARSAPAGAALAPVAARDGRRCPTTTRPRSNPPSWRTATGSAASLPTAAST